MTDAGHAPTTATPDRAPSRLARVRKAVRRHPAVTVALLMLLILIAVAILSPVLAPYPPKQQVGTPFAKPSAAHWLGLDDAGEDELSRVMWGSRISLLIGFSAAAIAMLVGSTFGVICGYFGGWLDIALVHVTDYFLAVPVVPLMLVVAAIFGRSVTNTILIIGGLSWMYVMRPVRAEVRSVRERGYVKRTRTIGGSHLRTIGKHVLPQVVPIIVALTILSVAIAVFAEAAISFLGLGDPSVISWGQLIFDAYQSSAITVHAWWVVLAPGILIAVVILCATAVGQTLEDSLNPRLSVAHVSRGQFRMRRTLGTGGGAGSS